MYYFLFGIFIYSIFLSLITRKYKQISKILSLLLFIFLTFMIGFRYGVGIDYFQYKEAFDLRYDTISYEIIYSALMYIVKIYFEKFHYLTFILILITNVFIYLGLKERNISNIYLILSIFIYSSNMLFMFTNGMRQGVAVAIFFYCSVFIKQRKFKKYLIFILIGAGFHYSILFLLPLYFINNKILSVKKYLFFILLSYLLLLTNIIPTILNSIVNNIPFYSNYNKNLYFNENVELLSAGVLLKVMLSITLVFFINKYKDTIPYSLEINYYLIGIILTILSLSTFMIGRIGYYFYIFEIASIPIMIKSVKSKNQRLFLVILVLLITSSFFVKMLILDPESHRLEYESVFLK